MEGSTPGEANASASPLVTVLLVDDHALFREGLASLLSYQPDFRVVGEAADGYEALERAREAMPDLVLMDIDMPRCDGLQATRLLKRELPYVRVLMLTVHDDDDKLFQSIQAGAQGYLLKNIRSAEMLEMLRGMARGEAPISRRMAARILAEFARRDAAPDEEDRGADLTQREREVLELVAQRYSNKEIAARLVISEYTVKNHMRNILQKLQLRSRAQAAAYAIGKGMVAQIPTPPPPRAST